MTTTHCATICGKEIHGAAHICAFIDSREQQYEIMLPFLKEGVERGEGLVTITDPANTEDHLARLGNAGLDLAELAAQGHMVDVRADQCYTRGGRFSGDEMYAILEQAADQALERGFSRARGFGEMQWAREGLPGTEELIAYESRVNYLSSKLLAICVYDVGTMSGRMMLDILNTHPQVIIGGQVHENPYYIHPDEFLKTRLAPKQA